MSKKTWIIFALICAALFAGLIVYAQRNRVDVSDVNVNTALPADERSGGIADHVLGNSNAKVTLIEYGDYQCPSCGGAHQNIKKLVEKHKANVQFIFRNFPLTSIHPNALAAAAAAEAAGLQGKFWEMYDIIYQNQDAWSSQSSDQRTDTFASYARQLGLDVEKLKADMSSDKVTKKIAFDQAVAKKANVSATPTFFLNGKEISKEVANDAVQKNADLLDKAITDAVKAQKNSDK